MAKKLTNQERLFIAEYMLCKKPKEAALNAGYAATTAHASAYQWVSDSKKNPKPHIYKEVQKRIGKIEDRLELKNEDVIREMMKIAFCNIQDVIGEDNKILDVSKMPRDVAASIGSVSTSHKKGESGSVKITLCDKKGALVDLARHLGLFEKDNEQQNIIVVIDD